MLNRQMAFFSLNITKLFFLNSVSAYVEIKLSNEKFL